MNPARAAAGLQLRSSHHSSTQFSVRIHTPMLPGVTAIGSAAFRAAHTNWTVHIHERIKTLPCSLSLTESSRFISCLFTVVESELRTRGTSSSSITSASVSFFQDGTKRRSKGSVHQSPRLCLPSPDAVPPSPRRYTGVLRIGESRDLLSGFSAADAVLPRSGEKGTNSPYTEAARRRQVLLIAPNKTGKSLRNARNVVALENSKAFLCQRHQQDVVWTIFTQLKPTISIS